MTRRIAPRASLPVRRGDDCPVRALCPAGVLFPSLPFAGRLSTGGAEAGRSVAQPVLVQQGAALAVLDLDQPEVGVAGAGAGEGGIDLGLGAFGEDHP